MKKTNIPDFVIVGAAKAGTTALHHILSQHTNIKMPKIKETNYFANLPTKLFGPGDMEISLKTVVREWGHYLSLFDGANSSQLCGEASPSYLFYTDSAQRIKDANADAKIIIMLRNPIDRAFSLYQHKVRDLREKFSFEEALEMEESRELEGWEWSWLYKKSGLYAAQVNTYVNTFAPDKLMVVLYEDFKTNGEEEVKRILKFLSVESSIQVNMVRSNVSGNSRSKMLQRMLWSDNYLKSFVKMTMPHTLRARIKDGINNMNTVKGDMNLSTRRSLQKYFKDDVEKLEVILNRNLQHWLS